MPFQCIIILNIPTCVKEEQRYCSRIKNSAVVEKFSLTYFGGSCHMTPVSSSARGRVIVSLQQTGHFHFFSPLSLFGSLYFIQTCLLSLLIFVLSPSFFTPFVILCDIKDLPAQIL